MTTSIAQELPDPYFLAFFDEAGDPGIKRVTPIDTNGASEWFILSCVVIKAENDHLPIKFIKRVKSQFKHSYRPDLHYRHLNESNKRMVCRELATESVRCFAVASHKPNMRGYINKAAEELTMHPNDWFYNFCIRVLLERMTEWCVNRSIRDTNSTQYAKLIFSERGGHNYRHVETYLHLLRNQVERGDIYLGSRVPDFRTIHHRLIEVEPHLGSAGCQLADIVASAFFHAVNTNAKKWSMEPAKLLKPRMARNRSRYDMEGVTLLPWQIQKARLSKEQKEIFEFYDFCF